MTQHTHKRACVYLRISHDRNETEQGVARQRKDALALAQREGIEVPEELIFVDNDITAKGTKIRPQFELMKKAIEAGRCTMIICYKLPRLSRNANDTAWLDTIGERRKITIMETSGTAYRLNDSSNSLNFGMLMVVASHQSKVTSELVKRLNEEKRNARKPAGGRRSFGYNGDMTIRESEAKHLRWAYQALINGESGRMITKHLNDHGAKTTTKREWTASGVTRLLRNPRNAGILMHNPEWQTNPKAPMIELGKGDWVPIIDEATWHAANVILKDPARISRHGAKQLLTGIAICGICGAKVNGGGANHTGTVYACTASRHLSRRAREIDALVVAQILARLSEPDAHDHVTADATDETANLYADKRRLNADLENVFALVGTSARSKAAAQKRITKIEADLDAIDAALARITTHRATAPIRALIDADDIEAHWQDSLTLDVKRMIIDEMVRIVIKPVGRGRRSFNPDLIEITFKG